MKAIVVSRKDEVYVRDLEPGDLVRLYNMDTGPKLYEVESVGEIEGEWLVTFKERERTRTGLLRYTTAPIQHRWFGDSIVTVVTRLRIEQPGGNQ